MDFNAKVGGKTNTSERATRVSCSPIHKFILFPLNYIEPFVSNCIYCLFILKTTGNTYPVRTKIYVDTEMVNLPTVQSFKYLGSTITSGGGAN